MRSGKYNNRPTRLSRTGRVYHSKQEALDALWLQSLVKDGKLTAIKEQVSVRLTCYNADGSKAHTFGTHLVDFLVTLPDGRQKYVETKGFATQIWRQFKRPMTELITDIPYLVNPNEKELLA